MKAGILAWPLLWPGVLPVSADEAESCTPSVEGVQTMAAPSKRVRRRSGPIPG
ncbi:MAG: hypothetical protein IT494_00385 [Gammaproteobacteria bacterium]|nr:hypothetical protein [Gammaproteobacteria bacterium]